MCTRYYMEMDPALRPIVEEAQKTPLCEKMIRTLARPLKTEGEIRPMNMVPVIASSRAGVRAVFPMVWGYQVQGLDRPLVNARIESAGRKELWKQGWEGHRCVIPASYYFEWEHIAMPGGRTRTGKKYAIQPKGSEVTWLAGLYRIEEYRGLKHPVFAILTRAPTEDLQRIHDRMPLMLPAAFIDEWIRPESRPEEIARQALTAMVIEEAG